MIEIRELVIRANVSDSGSGSRERPSRERPQQERGGCCEENLDLVLKMLKEKNER
jgi:hypothetical protein